MSFLENVRVALGCIWANKLRSFLTMLGIVIGVSAVIGVVSIGQGGQSMIIEEIESLGANLIIVFPKTIDDKQNYQEPVYLASEDIQDIERSLGDLAAVSPEMDWFSTVCSGAIIKSLKVLGVADTFPAIRNLAIGEGRFVSKYDVFLSKRVAVIGSELSDDLFNTSIQRGRRSAIGQKIDIGGHAFTVIGVTKDEKPGLITTDEVSGYSVLIPYTTLSRLTGNEAIPILFAAAGQRTGVKPASTAIRRMLDKRYGPGRFEVQNLDMAIEAVGQVTTVMTAVVGGIAAIALLVGGIGIMNIMLVSVTERTKEIGLRKALGATRSQILSQFLVEAIVLSGCGGIVGIGVGVALAQIVSYFGNLPSLVSWFSILVGFGFSVVIGVVFGTYPASRASRMDPIEALRHE